MIYFAFAAVATAFAYMAVHSKQRKVCYVNGEEKIRPQWTMWLLSFLAYFIPAAIRYGIGQDYFYTYYPMFNWIRQSADSIYTGEAIAYSEIGFNLLNRIIAYFTADAQWLFVVTAFICLAIAYKCISDYSDSMALSVFMLVLGSYYLGSYSLIRQSIAIVIFVFSLRYVEARKPLRYAICMALAISMHTIAIIYIPFYFLRDRKFEKKTYIISAVVIVVGMRVLASVITRIVAMTRFADRINFGSDYNILLSLVVTCVFLVALFGYDESKDDPKYRIYLNIVFAATCLIGLSSFLDTTDRVIFAYYYSNFITIPYFLKHGKFGRNRQLIILGLFIALVLLWGYEHLYYDQFSILPYVSIFSAG